MIITFPIYFAPLGTVENVAIEYLCHAFMIRFEFFDVPNVKTNKNPNCHAVNLQRLKTVKVQITPLTNIMRLTGTPREKNISFLGLIGWLTELHDC